MKTILSILLLACACAWGANPSFNDLKYGTNPAGTVVQIGGPIIQPAGTSNSMGAVSAASVAADLGGSSNLNMLSITGSFGMYNLTVSGGVTTNGESEFNGNGYYYLQYGGGMVELVTNSMTVTNIHAALGAYSNPTNAYIGLFPLTAAQATTGVKWGFWTNSVYSNLVTLPTYTPASPKDYPISPSVTVTNGYYAFIAMSASTNVGEIKFAYFSSDTNNTNYGRCQMPSIDTITGRVNPAGGAANSYAYGSAGFRLDGYVTNPVPDFKTFLLSLGKGGSVSLANNASSVDYDNGTTGISGTNLQTALDEVGTNAIRSSKAVVPRIILPDEFTAVVGDSLQIFVRGIIEAQNPYWLPYELNCAVGAQYPRYFSWTPTNFVNSQALTVNIMGLDGTVIASGSAALKAFFPVKSPSTNINVLCVGDSLTAGGTWPTEFYRRLTQSGGSPSGYGFTNITFVGDYGIMPSYPGQFWTGYGGASFDQYMNRGIYTNSGAWLVTTNWSVKGPGDFQSLFTDVNGHQWWFMQTTNTGMVKVAPYSFNGGWSIPDAPSTLTYTSGGTNTSNIYYTSASSDAPFSFWNSNAQAFSFSAFCNRFGITGGIQAAYILLGWNGIAGANSAWPTNHSTQLGKMQDFVNQLHADYPNALVRVIGLEVPSTAGGLGANYGAMGSLANYYKSLRTVNGWNLGVQQVADYSTNSPWLKFISLSQQFDSEYNMPLTSTAVNSRNSSTNEALGSNGIHPATSGYYQIADTATRDFVRYFCQTNN